MKLTAVDSISDKVDDSENSLSRRASDDDDASMESADDSTMEIADHADLSQESESGDTPEYDLARLKLNLSQFKNNLRILSGDEPSPERDDLIVRLQNAIVRMTNQIEAIHKEAEALDEKTQHQDHKVTLGEKKVCEIKPEHLHKVVKLVNEKIKTGKMDQNSGEGTGAAYEPIGVSQTGGLRTTKIGDITPEDLHEVVKLVIDMDSNRRALKRASKTALEMRKLRTSKMSHA